MYVVPSARGKGLARAMLAELERTARAAGHRKLILETGRSSRTRCARYTARPDYTDVPAFGFYADCGVTASTSGQETWDGGPVIVPDPWLHGPLSDIDRDRLGVERSPRRRRITAMGRVPPGGGGRRPPLPARRGQRVARVQATVQRGPGADRRPGSVPDTGPPDRPVFSVAPDVRPLPKSLVNIFTELLDDLGPPAPSTGDLSPWAERGVLLLNRALTVEPGKPNSHQGKGWEEVTEQAIRALAARGGRWWRSCGAETRATSSRCSATVPCIESAHPSPLSAHNGFFAPAVQPRQPASGAAGRRADRLEAALTSA
jgi:hypothetical protein